MVSELVEVRLVSDSFGRYCSWLRPYNQFFLGVRLLWIPPRQCGCVVVEVRWSVSMMMVAIEDVVRADAMDAAGGAFNLFYLSAQCAH